MTVWITVMSAMFVTFLLIARSNAETHSRLALTFRSLVPNWRFFEDIDAWLELEFRVVSDETEPAWRPMGVPRRTWFQLFLNGEGNLRLARHSLIESLAVELDGMNEDDAPSLVTYRMVLAGLEDELQRTHPSASRVQFRIIEGVERTELYRSPIETIE